MGKNDTTDTTPTPGTPEWTSAVEAAGIDPGSVTIPGANPETSSLGFSSVDSGFGGFNNTNLKTLLGQALGLSTSGVIDPYMQVGSAGDVSNVNQFTNSTMASLQAALGQSGPVNPGMGNYGLNQLGGTNLGPGQAAASAFETQLLGELGGTGGNTAYADSIGQRAREIAGQTYSSGNALYSGAAQGTIADSVTRALTESSTKRIGALSQGLQGLAGVQGGIEQARLGSSAGLLGSLAGTQAGLDTSFGRMGMQNQQGLLSLMASLSGRESFSPTYTQNPFFMSPMQAWSLDQTGTANAFANIGGITGAAMGGAGAAGQGIGSILAALA